MKIVLALAVVFAGGLTAIQLGMNAQLRHSFGHGTLAALVNFLVGTVLLVALVTAARIPIPSWTAATQVPAWAWLGGACGAFLITIGAIAGRELGALQIGALLVTGQLLMGLVLDHFGWFGFPVRPFTLAKLCGCGLLVTSLILFREN